MVNACVFIFMERCLPDVLRVMQGYGVGILGYTLKTNMLGMFLLVSYPFALLGRSFSSYLLSRCGFI
jgi:hypothetical protein